MGGKAGKRCGHRRRMRKRAAAMNGAGKPAPEGAWRPKPTIDPARYETAATTGPHNEEPYREREGANSSKAAISSSLLETPAFS